MNGPFWQTKPLTALSTAEWESLCDRCGRCCLFKLENEEDGSIHYTRVACRLLDLFTCNCADYAHRREQVPDCTVLTAERIGRFGWLPDTCAYRLLAEGKPLPSWHPLVSGNSERVHGAGISVRGFAIPESAIDDPDDLQDHLLEDTL